MSNQQSQQPEPARADTMLEIAKVVLGAVVVVVALPLLLPAIAYRVVGDTMGRKTAFWRTDPVQVVVASVGGLGWVAVLVWEIVVLVRYVRSGKFGVDFAGPLLAQLGPLWSTVWPWLLLNLACGLLLVPSALLLRRRVIADRARRRVIADVTVQHEIEMARQRAIDPASARRVGVRVSSVDRQIRAVSRRAIRAPHTVNGAQALGLVGQPTIRTGPELWADRSRVPDWMDSRGRWITLPRSAGSIRAVMIAESGSGKTEFLNDVIAAAAKQRMRIVFLDAKGNPDDARKTAAVARAVGSSAAIGPAWDFFHGSAAEVTAKIMRQIPATSSDASYYRDEILAVLEAVQAQSPVRSIADLRERLLHPEGYCSGDDLAVVATPVGRGDDTAGSRSLQRLLGVLRPLAPWIGQGRGWSFDALPADVTIVPLSPVDEAQVRLGDTMLFDLRNHLAARMRRGDRSDLLVVVDEYPQLVTDGRDPADTAASTFEVARSAGVGLILAAQSTAGLSAEPAMRTRALSSGAALIFGRTKDPEDLVSFAGTVERLEASGDAHGAGVRSGRSQHTYAIPPDAVRSANIGQFWIVQGGGRAQFRALATLQGVVDESEPAGEQRPPEASLIVDHQAPDRPPDPDAAPVAQLELPAAPSTFRPSGFDDD